MAMSVDVIWFWDWRLVMLLVRAVCEVSGAA